MPQKRKGNISKAIRTQTAAIERQTEVIERLARNFERVFGSGIEKQARKIASMATEQRKELDRSVLAELIAERVD